MLCAAVYVLIYTAVLIPGALMAVIVKRSTGKARYPRCEGRDSARTSELLRVIEKFGDAGEEAAGGAAVQHAVVEA